MANVPTIPTMDATAVHEARKPEEAGTRASTPTLQVMDTLMYPCTPAGMSPPYYGGIHELDHDGKAYMQRHQHETEYSTEKCKG